MMEDKNGSSVPRLRSGNYQNWKFYENLLLVRDSVWNGIADPIPVAPGPDWITKDGKAKVIIGLSVNESQVITIENFPHAKDYWNALKDVH